MNNKGFTLIQFLLFVMLLLVIFLFSLAINRQKLSTSLSGLVNQNHQDVFAAAENYVIHEDIPFNSDNYVCVTKKRLERTGYLKKVDNIDRTIKLSRNKITKVIDKIEYVNECE